MMWLPPEAQAKLSILADAYGFEVMELLVEYGSEGLVPAICMRNECDAVAELEPDARDGWCAECNHHAMVSALVLAELL